MGQGRRAGGIPNLSSVRTCKLAITYLPGSARGQCGLSPRASQTPTETIKRLRRGGKREKKKLRRQGERGLDRVRAGKGRERRQGKDVKREREEKWEERPWPSPSTTTVETPPIPGTPLAHGVKVR